MSLYDQSGIRYWRRLTSTEESWVSFFNVMPAVDNREVALAAYVMYDSTLKCLKCLDVYQLKDRAVAKT